MPHFDGTAASIDFLKYDLVNLAYHLPNIETSAVIGVGGGRDVLAAHLFGVKAITGVELNRIFIDLHLRDPFYSSFSNLRAVPGLTLHVDDARSWFAATDRSFDLIQMSMIDTWAATSAGAFTLSENGLYTLEGWRAFTRRLTDRGVFTVSRWYNPGDVNESGRMIALAVGTMIDAGAADPRRHVFVATGGNIATLVLARSPLTPAQLTALRDATARLGFDVLVDPDTRATLRRVARADDSRRSRAARTRPPDRPGSTSPSPPTSARSSSISCAFGIFRQCCRCWCGTKSGTACSAATSIASIALVLVVIVAAIAVLCTIVLPLRHATRNAPPGLIAAGTTYFALIGTGFMFAEISLLQYFGVFLGHPIYAMSVCLFSLILSAGLGSLASDRLALNTAPRIAVWGALVSGYLFAAQAMLPGIFAAMSSQCIAGAHRGGAGGVDAGGIPDGIRVPHRHENGGGHQPRTGGVVLGHQRRHRCAGIDAGGDDRDRVGHQRHDDARRRVLPAADSCRARSSQASGEDILAGIQQDAEKALILNKE